MKKKKKILSRREITENKISKLFRLGRPMSWDAKQKALERADKLDKKIKIKK